MTTIVIGALAAAAGFLVWQFNKLRKWYNDEEDMRRESERLQRKNKGEDFDVWW